ncbi:MAG: DODA-type extradiol aromatic ring-opening family dioxygenase, partial [Polyangiaceae bacterium]
GFDHGTFVPLKLTYPDADVPTVQLSLEQGLDPARHLAMGRALAPLRDEGVLLVGSGMSYHNLQKFMRHAGAADSAVFDEWLRRIAVAEPRARDEDLVRWSSAPAARAAHPREEHLLPLMVMAGAGGDDRGHVAYSGAFGGARITAVHFDRA